MKFMFLLYDFLWGTSPPLIGLLLAARRILFGKPTPAFRSRLGRNLPPAAHPDRGSIWIHAVSVGEVLVMEPMIMQLLSSESPPNIFLSTTTWTGQELSQKKFKDPVQVFYCPFDSHGAVKRTFAHIRPSMMIIAETEIWPNLLRVALQQGVPVFFVNGRISDDAFPRYRRIRGLLRPVFRMPDLFLVQSTTDRHRFLALGARSDQVKVTGNMKFDAIRQISANHALIDIIRAHFNNESARILLCGSTMDGEEKILCTIFQELVEAAPELHFIVAPRHPERFDLVAQLFRESGFTVALRSDLEGPSPPAASRILILNSLGELASIYNCANMVFVGGTLVPTGGHNILEPAAAGKAVLVGPSMENFREILEIFKKHNAVCQIADAKELSGKILEWLENPGEPELVAAAANKIIARHQGATRRNLDLIRAELRSSANQKQHSPPKAESLLPPPSSSEENRNPK